MAKLGKYNLFVLSESPRFSVETTSYPVEKGIAFTDHVKAEPEELNVEVFLSGSNYQKTLDQLKNSMYKGEIMTYAGRAIVRNVIIESISANMDKSSKNGVQVSLSLKQIRVATTPYTKPKTKPPTNSGKKQPIPKGATQAVYHVAKQGDSYWLLSKKYGTSISQLQAWNRYPPTKIPIGVKLRVK
ncbi:LysM peptidoglycan-binding domain-containing protein [Geobacillus subterraneus]|uniref:LysM peptidoglycan-binding domain-containing protein n=1 Tax=Geobacillus subterraneus TaxID=129338 RepID=UPI002AC896C2|nr:LysM peptidoglycan-binding domain-containing protein [Geobacillus subterraneus]WPZ17787.1 LysM peptidoglycan-binding domain-containing protein [Geobacillus subterraneus]